MLDDLNPVERDGERNIWCRHYDTCLDYAVENFWQRWDCSQCKYLTNQELKIDIQAQENEIAEFYDVTL